MNEDVRVLTVVAQEARWNRTGICFTVNGHKVMIGDCIGSRIPTWPEFRDRCKRVGMEVSEFTKEAWR